MSSPIRLLDAKTGTKLRLTKLEVTGCFAEDCSIWGLSPETWWKFCKKARSETRLPFA